MTHLPSDFPENRRFSWNSFIQARNAKLFFSPPAFSFLIDILCSWVRAKTFSTRQPLTCRVNEINKKKKITCDSHKSCLSPRIRPTTDNGLSNGRQPGCSSCLRLDFFSLWLWAWTLPNKATVGGEQWRQKELLRWTSAAIKEAWEQKRISRTHKKLVFVSIASAYGRRLLRQLAHKTTPELWFSSAGRSAWLKTLRLRRIIR